MPRSRLQQLNSNSVLGIWNISETTENLERIVASNGFDLSRSQSITSALKRRQWLGARCLLSEMLPLVTEVKYDVNGAPTIDGGQFVSFSHSAERAAIIISTKEDVGVDIQEITEKIDRIKHKFLHPQEAKSEHQGKLEYLHIIWSAKEAIYKKLRIPGLIFKEEILIHEFELSNEGEIYADVKRNSLQLKLKYEIIDGYSLVYTLID